MSQNAPESISKRLKIPKHFLGGHTLADARALCTCSGWIRHSAIFKVADYGRQRNIVPRMTSGTALRTHMYVETWLVTSCFCKAIPYMTHHEGRKLCICTVATVHDHVAKRSCMNNANTRVRFSS